MRIVLRTVGIVVAIILLLAVLYAGNIAVGMHSTATVDGTIAGTGVTRPYRFCATPAAFHIFAQPTSTMSSSPKATSQAQDRLFQLDLLRRFVYGDLSEILGTAAL